MLAESPPLNKSRSRSFADRAGALRVVLKEEFGVDFHFFDAATGASVKNRTRRASGESSRRAPALTVAEVLELAGDGRARVLPRAEGNYQLALLLYQGRRPAFVATA